MRRVLETINDRTQTLLETHPFLKWLQKKDEEDHLGEDEEEKFKVWVPVVMYFVLAFKDLNMYTFKYPEEEAKQDQLKQLINEHCQEDGNHWPMFLQDLEILGLNENVNWVTALKFLWGGRLTRQRLAHYDFIKLSHEAQDPRLRFVLMFTLEKCGNILFRTAVNAANELELKTGKKLLYFGQTHLDREEGHLECNPNNIDCQDEIWQQELIESEYIEAIKCVNKVVDINSYRWAEYLEFALSNIKNKEKEILDMVPTVTVEECLGSSQTNDSNGFF